MTLCGFTSRCITPFAWAKESATSNCSQTQLVQIAASKQKIFSSNLMDVIAYIMVRQRRIENFEIRICYVLKNERRGFTTWIPYLLHKHGELHLAKERWNHSMKYTVSRSCMTLGPPRRFWRILISRLIFRCLTWWLHQFLRSLVRLKIGTDVDIPDRFQTFNNDLLFCRDFPAFKYLAVFASSNFPNYFVIFTIVPVDWHILVVRVCQKRLWAANPPRCCYWWRRHPNCPPTKNGSE